ncbi:YokU family protein [Bacillus luteolus]|uniref:YokU family protein n=1 Tax=Litchfieldia luteola TaxID=682179 RepID=A0ABR9QNL7_9BACI|nr:YokU family protein [Cytobacillus luteolus]MBE4910087.1 YokU family protein [Cytobacillus luteolus]MBP1942349.1 putative YokU family protein [Cytobacillus luteolus]
MEINCEWCGGKASNGENTVYWELPDGSRAIEIRMTPAVVCKECEMVYQDEDIIKEIEDQLFLVDTKKIGSSIGYRGLMELPRLLKRNYFDFSS